MIDDYVFLDKLPPEISDAPAVYIFTQPIDLRNVTYQQTLEMYTTDALKLVIWSSETMKKNLKTIDVSGQPCHTELPNGKTLSIRAFSYESKTLNVPILLECDGQFTLYTGRCVVNDKILKHTFLTNVMRENKITDLYFDTRAHFIEEFNAMRTTCDEIQSLLKSETAYKFQMLIKYFGYEDLIFMLAQRGIQIYLDEWSKVTFGAQQMLEQFCTKASEADIVLINDLPSNSDIAIQYQQQIITIVPTHRENASDVIDGLKYVKYTVYPTQSNLHYIAHLTAPLHIHNTCSLPAVIPEFLKSLCRRPIDQMS